MTFYDVLSTTLTILGNVILIYRITFELETQKQTKRKKKTQQKLCTKWVIFAIFLKLQYWLLAILQIIPFGSVSLLAIKLILFLPENAISTMIYKKIQKKLEKISLDEYNSWFGEYLSYFAKHLINLLMKLIKKVSPFVNSKDIEQSEAHILDIIKIMEYKKAAVLIRKQAHASKINNDLDMSEFNNSMSEEEAIALQDEQSQRKQDQKQRLMRKSTIGNAMSKILADVDDDQEVLKAKVDVMIIRPNKEKGTLAKFQEATVEFYINTSKLSVTNKNKAVQSGTLKEVRWVTKNMINLQLVFQEGRSKIVKLKDKTDVSRWVEPVCQQLSKKKAGKK